MNRFRNRKGSIYGQLAWLLIAATILSVGFFMILNRTGNYLINYFITHTDYLEREDNKRIDKLQAYITNQKIASTDSKKLTDWVNEQSVIAVQIYKNGFMVYDSNYPEEDFGKEAPERHYSWETFYTLLFADGEAEVVLYGFYDYQFYNYALVGELILSFLLLLGIVMLGIRKKIWYILRLGREIKILEGGDLNCPITISGRDELTRLAEGLDAMRKSFRAQTEQEKQLTLANQRMITEMSHDLRTPLTSIMLYTEILLKGKYENTEQMMEYIEKIDKKARRLKHLSAHLFEYSLIAGETRGELEKPILFKMAFYDMWSETTAYLEQQGFQIDMDIFWEERHVRINTDYIIRIFDNLTSNIVKYADCNVPVCVKAFYSEQSAGFTIKNKKAAPKEGTESTQIGLQNIKNMMVKLGGQTVVGQTENEFELLLQFPCTLLLK